MIYEYECSVHGVFEVEQSIKDNKLEFCPKCLEEGNKVEVRKLISKTSFVLEGGGCGWGRNNYSANG